MGQVSSLFYNAVEIDKSALIERPISSYIYTFIDRMNNANALIPMNEDIILLIMKFIGFIIHSSIVNENEAASLYKMLMDHHKSNGLKSPLTQKNYISYFEYIYGQNIDSGQYDIAPFIQKFLKFCVDKPGLLLIFETKRHHVFAYYLRKPIKRMENMNKRKMQTIYDDNPIYLLRVATEIRRNGVLVKYGEVPRIVKKIISQEPAFKHDTQDGDDLFIGNVLLMPRICRMRDSHDISVFEQFGETFHDFVHLRRIEVLQLL